jgi:DNA-binding CsgD family transcriptional regulator
MDDKPTPPALSDRELELLRLVATGASNQQIARQLHISVNTVKVHLRNIFEKLGVESRTEASMVAIREGWVAVEGAPAAPPAEPTPAPPAPPAIERISLAQRLFMLAAALIVALLAFLPPLGQTLTQSQPQSPFTERPAAPPLVIADERTARWNNLPAMPTARGRLALVQRAGKLYAIGGDTDAGVTGALEVYDIGASRWSSLPDKPTPAGNIGAAFAAGRIWVPGGFLADGAITARVETFDISAGVWGAGPDLPEPLCAYALTAFEDNLYLFGGANSQGNLAVAYRLDTRQEQWEALPALPGPRAFAAAAVLNGRIYLLGGYDGQRELNSCLVFDPAAEGAGRSPWGECPPLNAGRGGLGAAVVGASLFAMGGGWENYLAYNEQFDMSQNRWVNVASPATGVWRNVAAAADAQRVYVAGGWDGRYLNTLRSYQAIVTVFLPFTQ